MSVLDEASCGDRVVASELMDFFFEQAYRILEDLLHASAEGDVAGIAAAAHTLAGSSSTCGLNRLAGDCRFIEHLCQQGETPAEADERISHLRARLDEARMYCDAQWKGAANA